eukprot:Gregarina_sp_Poly_1__7996@NODE_458_length_8212_cov_59_372376_g373_i0_p4_GENE_NODE_458_length_8212_cov_59_372376_g373_i0NODE_458_length_8212_cov_59_372376_g373_i0_p4_ORF_typecomplete_len147_score8_15Bap31/PF05529_12/5_3e07_NODE_458_length_8212_cov_59_372376_g373_i069097349
MHTLIWSFMTYIILGSGLFITLLIFSGIHLFERCGGKLCSIGIGCGGNPKRPAFNIRIPLLFLMIAGCAVVSEHWALSNLKSRRADLIAAQNLVGVAELRAKVLRHQRNWWISLASVLVWCIVWRFSGIVRGLREELRVLKSIPKF